MCGKEMTRQQPTIIVGGGLTGLTMAAALNHIGQPLILIAPKNETIHTQDKRSTAIMMDGIQFLTEIGVWSNITSTPLEVMRIIQADKETDFKASEMNRDAFALNVLNMDIKHRLKQNLEKSKNIRIVDDQVVDIKTTQNKVTVKTLKGETHSGALLIAADGRQSTIRDLLKISTYRHDFKQKAIVCTLSHTHSHNNTSTEIHRAGGPFTLVPLPGKESALVWCDHAKTLDKVMLASNPDKQGMIQKIIGPDILGDIELTSQCQIWPIHGLKAKTLIAPRTVLIGESAHALAPIAAQGFNLSLRDIQSLTRLIDESIYLGLDIGRQVILKRYQQQRQNDIALRYHTIGLLNTLIAQHSIPARLLRRLGLSAMTWIPPLRQAAMRFGMRA